MRCERAQPEGGGDSCLMPEGWKPSQAKKPPLKKYKQNLYFKKVALVSTHFYSKAELFSTRLTNAVLM